MISMLKEAREARVGPMFWRLSLTAGAFVTFTSPESIMTGRTCDSACVGKQVAAKARATNWNIRGQNLRSIFILDIRQSPGTLKSDTISGFGVDSSSVIV